MKKQIHAIFTLIILISSFSLFAANVSPSLFLENIQATTQGKKSVKKIYFIITSFSSQNNNEFYTVPGFIPFKGHHTQGYIPSGAQPFPIYYWSSEAFSQLKHARIWNGSLKDHDSVELNISIMQRDSPPWNLDDELGTIKVILQNEDTGIKVLWDASKNISLQPVGDVNAENTMYQLNITQKKINYQLNLYLEKNTPEMSRS